MKAIVACDINWGIGYKGCLQQRVHSDQRRFRALTTGKVIIYGRKTLETFPRRNPLPNRENLILHTRKEPPVDGADFVTGLDDLRAKLAALRKKGYKDDDFFVIGGGVVYRLLLPWTNEVLITQFHDAYDADVWFPRIDKMPEWQLVSCGDWLEENGVRFRYMTYRRKDIA